MVFNFSLENESEVQKLMNFEHGYALIVGVGSDLPVTVKDASVMAEILRDKSRCGYLNDNVLLLTEDNARRQDILDGLDWLSEKTNNDPLSVAIIYFSGHGGAYPEYHLVPFGYDRNKFYDTAILGTEFTIKINNIRSKKTLVLLDCCHAGGIGEVKLQAFSSEPIPLDVSHVLLEGSGKALIASSRRDEVSYTGSPYSIFTQALREGLAGYGASDQRGLSYLADVALYVGRWVANRSNDKQHPILKLSQADNFPLAFYAGGDEKLKKLDESDLDELFTIDNTSYIEGYVGILGKYRKNLLEIEEQMSQFYDQAAIPLDLRRTKNGILEKIFELEKIVKG